MHARRKTTQGEIQALSDPMTIRLDGIMQKKWDLGIPSSDIFLLTALKYESMQHYQWDPRGKTTLHLQECVDVEQWISLLRGKLINGWTHYSLVWIIKSLTKNILFNIR